MLSRIIAGGKNEIGFLRKILKGFELRKIFLAIKACSSMKVLIVYHSRTGNTKKVAEGVAEGLKSKNREVVLKSPEQVKNQDFLDVECIGLGSPTYFRAMSSELKKVIDESIEVYGKLKGKKGFVFTTSGCKEDGEKCLCTLFEVLDCHGIEVLDKILVVGKPNKQDLNRCVRFGERLSTRL